MASWLGLHTVLGVHVTVMLHIGLLHVESTFEALAVWANAHNTPSIVPECLLHACAPDVTACFPSWLAQVVDLGSPVLSN